MNLQIATGGRVLCLHSTARRLQIPERTLRYHASRGRVPGAFRQGKLWKWKFRLVKIEAEQNRRRQTDNHNLRCNEVLSNESCE